MTLQFDELTSVAERLIGVFEGRVPFETLCTTIRTCSDAHPRASMDVVERLARTRLLHDFPPPGEPQFWEEPHL